MTTCARCSRQLKNPVLLSGVPFGKDCARAVAGARPKRQRKPVQSHAVEVDPRQLPLELEAQPC